MTHTEPKYTWCKNAKHLNDLGASLTKETICRGKLPYAD